MPQISYRANLASAGFPFPGSFNHGQTVIVGGQDQNFSRQLAAKADQDRSVGIPQVFFGRNIMPVEQGYASLRQSRTIGGGYSGATVTSEVLPCLQSIGGGTPDIFMLDRSTGSIIPRSGGAVSGTTNTVSSYVLNGVTRYYRSAENYTIAGGTKFVASTLGLTMSDIVDMTACAGYNLAISNNTFFRSSTTNIDDFVPSAVTGAGSESVQYAQGRLRALVPGISGVYIICDGNIVFARYTGNRNFPFAFQPVENSGALLPISSTASIIDAKVRISDCFTPSDVKHLAAGDGLFVMTPSSWTPVFPELLDYFAYQSTQRSLFFLRPGEYNLTSDEVFGAGIGVPLQIVVAAQRYICYKYTVIDGLNRIPCWAVYDTNQQRWGQIYNWQIITDYFDVGQAIGLEPNLITCGSGMRRMDKVGPGESAGIDANNAGSIVLGRYQYVRSRMLELHSVDIQGGPPLLRAVASLDGSNTGITYAPTLVVDSAQQRRYFFDMPAAYNFSLIAEGGFHMTSLVLRMSVHGNSML